MSDSRQPVRRAREATFSPNGELLAERDVPAVVSDDIPLVDDRAGATLATVVLVYDDAGRWIERAASRGGELLWRETASHRDGRLEEEMSDAGGGVVRRRHTFIDDSEGNWIERRTARSIDGGEPLLESITVRQIDYA